MPGVTGSLVIIALGAILKFAITASADGIDINAIGVILMIVGAIGLVLSLLFWSSFSPYGRSRRSSATVVERRDIVP